MLIKILEKIVPQPKLTKLASLKPTSISVENSKSYQRKFISPGVYYYDINEEATITTMENLLEILGGKEMK